MLPVGAKLSVAGSNNSAVSSLPPATSTLPFINKVAVCPLRAVLIFPTGLKFELSEVDAARIVMNAVPDFPGSATETALSLTVGLNSPKLVGAVYCTAVGDIVVNVPQNVS